MIKTARLIITYALSDYEQAAISWGSTMSDDSRGPIESHEWPSQLAARAVVDAADEPETFGYDVERDLAHYYSF